MVSLPFRGEMRVWFTMATMIARWYSGLPHLSTGSVMRVVENILLVIGVTTLGALAGYYLFMFPFLLLFMRSRPDGVGGTGYAMPFVIVVCLVGAAIGAIIGLRMGFRLMNGRSGQPWKPSVWIGMAMAIAFALTIMFSGWLANHGGILFFFGEWWVGRLIFIAALGTLGGITGNFIGMSLPEGHEKGMQKKKKKRRQPDKLESGSSHP